MKIKIQRVVDQNLVDAIIKKGNKKEMPSISNGWRFNFYKHYDIPESEAYILVAEETPNVIEGCLIFRMKDKVMPYMAYVEIAPHNKGDAKKYQLVGGALIAWACRLSFMRGKEHHRGWLTFDVQEPTEEGKLELMGMYSQKYNARLFDGTTMVIMPQDGKELINKYLTPDLPEP